MKTISTIIGLLLLIVSCSDYEVITSENKFKGDLIQKYSLKEWNEKKIPLDASTAPQSPYIQLYQDSLEGRVLSLLNPHINGINFYSYDSGDSLRTIKFVKEGPHAILRAMAYYIKNLDSIYVFNMPLMQLVLTNHKGEVVERIPLRGNESNWQFSYPQYMFNTASPILEMDNHLLLTGLSPFSIHNDSIGKFRFTADVDMTTHKVSYRHLYPAPIYGGNSNWEDPLFMQVYTTLNSNGQVIHSFPPSHDLRLSQWESEEYTYKYAGSNVAGTIYSIDWDYLAGEITPRELIYSHFLKQDLYASILYDPWRKVYYRFLRQQIPGATTRSHLNDKKIIVIILDEQFNYLGESLIGTGKQWKWTNAFVTEEGLNIEYIDTTDTEELYMHFKIFKPQLL